MVTNLCITDFTVSTKLKNSICSSFFKVILFENFNVFKLYKKDVHFNIIDLVLIQRIYPEGWYRFTPNIKIDLVRLPSFTTFEIFFIWPNNDLVQNGLVQNEMDQNELIQSESVPNELAKLRVKK